ncbi:Glycosyltransferase family 39 protein [Mycena kentingensis (nom. inval.)]|nr:Glycosyltransferase family 39 protein [Mycena kentingensis (nom. inval.)]
MNSTRTGSSTSACRNTYLAPNPFILLPFNAGPRICLGQQFAYQESSFFLIRLLQRFSAFRLAPDAQPEESKPPRSWQESGTEMQKREKITFGTSLTMYAKGVGTDG